MMRFVTWFAQALLVTALALIALPRLYDMAFAPRVAPTYLFYSPVSQEFIYREHHGNHDFVYASESGATYDRPAFEKLLPFIYYKNMDIWGLLPIRIDGQSYGRDTIRDARQVVELKARELPGNRPEIPVYALIDSDPGRARLSFPEDVFVPRDSGLEVLNVDVNRPDPDLTDRFNAALAGAGFAFPARLVAGKQTILKPWDAGVFLVDATGAVFHLTRTGDTPHAVRTPIPADLGIHHIKVTESTRREILGLVLTGDARLFLLTMPGYGLIELPTDGYDPDRMNYKLLLNPVAPTAVYGDDKVVHGVAMTPDYAPRAEYARDVPGTADMAHARIARALFPLTLSLQDGPGPYLRWHLAWSGWAGLIGIALSLAALFGLARARRAPLRQTLPAAALVTLTGPAGLLAVLAVPGHR
ncbi:DUF4857 domain-containing protein [Rhodovulum adriaticum]|uniref:Uncharacterized protein DUF4857 n=1 Tax=Rhodovulum adriaticum TaxID=35804 RepID=A0A4R2NKD7_RHOAD|nr:DUF4857 domain-containing protein [Rhodovulum adriaticum]MBK1637208.1 hypothetical protein [Rhodovulum adriaticum]TCP21967.1 uncharacterized protein DUF4857 [Rhodovulum adriaticum]